jgi:hypothetical protein
MKHTDTLVWDDNKMEDLRVSQLRWHENTMEDLPYDREEIKGIREKLFVNDNDRLRAPDVIYNYNNREILSILECESDPMKFTNHLEIFHNRDLGFHPLELNEDQEGIIIGHLLNKYTIVSKPRQMGTSTAIRVAALFEAIFQKRSVTIATFNETNAMHQYDLMLDMYQSLPYYLKPGVILSAEKRKIKFDNGAQILFSSVARLGVHTPDTLMMDNMPRESFRHTMNLIRTMLCRENSRILICDTGMEHEITETVYQNLMEGEETRFVFGHYGCEWERFDPNHQE